MIIKNLIKNKDGSMDFEFSVDQQEAEFLMHYAVTNLIREGIIKDHIDNQVAEGQQELDFMVDLKLDKEKLN